MGDGKGIDVTMPKEFMIHHQEGNLRASTFSSEENHRRWKKEFGEVR